MILIFNKKITIAFIFCLTLLFASVCSAEIERTVEPFTKAVSFTSKYSFSDSKRDMHSIALVKSFKPLKGVVGGKDVETDTYFLLNFTLPQGVTLGDFFTIQVTPRHTNALPLSPYLVSGIGFSSVPTARTGYKDLLDMTKVAIERGENLLVRVDFSRGHDTYTIPAEVVQEWAKVLHISGANDERYLNKESNANEQISEQKEKQTTENKTQ